jgi:hypothetical protein
MSLPKVHVMLTADGRGEVWINDQKVPAVLAVQVTGAAGDMPQVVLTVRPGELTMDLPETGVQLLHAGPTASDFADKLDPRRLERDALERIDEATQGEAFAAAVLVQAGEFDDCR